MFLVIWGHCVQFLLTSDYLDEPAYIYIYSFHMPLFFMISGLFTRAELKPSLLLTRARQLLLPCVAWGLLMSAGNLIQPLLTGTHVDKSLLSTLYTNFWFLKSLFVCFALWFVSITLLRHRWLALLMSLIASQFIVVWDVQWSYPAFAVGVLLSPYIGTIRRHRRPIALTSFLIGGILLLGWNKSYFLIPSVYSWSTIAPSAVIMSIAMRFYRFFIGISLSLGFIALFLNLEERFSAKSSAQTATLPLLADWGKLTLGIYIIHTLFIIVRERLCPGLFCCDALNPWLFNIAVAPLAAAVLLLVSVGITRLIMLLPRLSFFFLGTPWPKPQVASTGK
ncbi:MAG: acyltransferase family protein [Paludibacteraceae bacterium]|nr:acyltransferase family protein [Paludibacteraceae bacterium]